MVVRQVRRSWRRLAAYFAIGFSVAGPSAIAHAGPGEDGGGPAAPAGDRTISRPAQDAPGPRGGRATLDRRANRSTLSASAAVSRPLEASPQAGSDPADHAGLAAHAVPVTSAPRRSAPLGRLVTGALASWQSLVAGAVDSVRAWAGQASPVGSGRSSTVGISGPQAISAEVASPNPPVVVKPDTGSGIAAFNRGETVSVVLGFDEPVYVQGRPTIEMTVGNRRVSAYYAGGSGGVALVFKYTVRAEDFGPVSLDGRISTSGRFPARGGIRRTEITNAAGVPVARTYTIPDTAGFYAVGSPQCPTTAQWQQLANQLSGQLIHHPTPPWIALTPGQQVPTDFNNPYYMSSFPGGSNLVGMQGAWTSTPSAYAVEAATTADVAAAVAFARQYGLRVVVKGTGHDYFGRSTGPSDSLLIWTHNMQGVTVQESFVPTGAPAGTASQQTVTTRAGNFYVDLWNALGEYNSANPDNPRYVQGSASGTVGVGGWTLGGGLAQYSKRYGSGAANIVQLEVVLADGRTVIANQYQNSDLFAAMRGGGGGTFGVMTTMTLATYPQPVTAGEVTGEILAKSDSAYRYLIKSFMEFLPTVSNVNWGGGITFVRNVQYQPEPAGTGRTGAQLYPFNYSGLTVDEAKAIWEPFLARLRANPDLVVNVSFPDLFPFQEQWTITCPVPGDSCDPRDPQRWWTDTVSPQASGYWEGWASRNVPRESLDPALIDDLVAAVYANNENVTLFEIGKGLYGAAPDAAERQQQTAMNPSFLNSVGLMSFLNQQTDRFPGVRGFEPDYAQARRHAATIYSAYQLLEQATPGGGSYFNQGNYFITDWAQQYWADNYARLLQAKQKYDPTNFFVIHQGVGSDLPSPYGRPTFTGGVLR